MSKTNLINAICKLHGKMANREWLKGRSMSQLQETYSRAKAVASVTAKEIRQHCDVSFIR